MIVLTAVIGTNLISDSFAMKAKGKPIWKYGSATSSIVCGDRLCSEISNEKNGYLSSIELQTQDKKTKVTKAVFMSIILISLCSPMDPVENLRSSG